MIFHVSVLGLNLVFFSMGTGRPSHKPRVLTIWEVESEREASIRRPLGSVEH